MMDRFNESKLFHGGMGSGKSIVACQFVSHSILQHNSICIGFDPNKGGMDMSEYLSSKFFLNCSNKMTEVDFLQKCENFILNAPSPIKVSFNLNRLLNEESPYAIIFLEEFHSIQDISKVSELIFLGLKKNIHFYLCSQVVTNSHLVILDQVTKYAFRSLDKKSPILLKEPLSANLTANDRGSAYVLGVKQKFIYESSKDLNNKIKLLAKEVKPKFNF